MEKVIGKVDFNKKRNKIKILKNKIYKINKINKINKIKNILTNYEK